MKLTKRLLAIFMVLTFTLGFAALSPMAEAADIPERLPCPCGWQFRCTLPCVAGCTEHMGLCCPPDCDDMDNCWSYLAHHCDYSCIDCDCYDLGELIDLLVTSMMTFAQAVLAQPSNHVMMTAINQDWWQLELASAWMPGWDEAAMFAAIALVEADWDAEMYVVFTQFANDLYTENHARYLVEARTQAMQLAREHFVDDAEAQRNAIVEGAFRSAFIGYVRVRMANNAMQAEIAAASADLTAEQFAELQRAVAAAQAEAFEDVNAFVLAAAGQWSSLAAIYAELTAEMAELLENAVFMANRCPDCGYLHCWCEEEPPPPPPPPWWYIFPSWIRWIIYRVIDMWNFVVESFRLVRVWWRS